MRTKRAATAVLAAALALLIPGVALAGYASFTDGPFGVHEEGVDWLARSGVTAGCTPSRYCPQDPVTRAQMATFMHRLSGRASDVAPSVDAASLDGRSAADLEVVNGLAVVTEEQRRVDAVVDVEAVCPEGTDALGGGGTIDALYAQHSSRPTDAGWAVVWVSDDHRAHEVDAAVTVICAPTSSGGAAAAGTSDHREDADALRAAVTARRRSSPEG